MKFADLRLAEPLLRAVSAEKYEIATPIQAQAIPPILEGKDVLGCAQTGTGKTAAFALPILNHLFTKSQRSAAPRVLILCPTRELAVQIEQSFQVYGQFVPHRRVTIFGGVSQHGQVQSLRRGVDIVVATPGRLMDLLEQRHVDLSKVEVFVLDEADRMLDMGFIHDVRRIASKVPAARQTLLFSATMPHEIKDLAHSLLRDPVKISITPPATTVEIIEQSVYMVEKANKSQLLAHLFHNLPIARGIVFSRTKHGADRVVKHLHALGIKSEAIHGNKSQNARQKALENFRSMRTPLLIATDIAARGIDIDGITHVVNYDLTHEPETYVHRIGRTARAGAKGTAISFCDRDERSNLRAIERLIRKTIPVETEMPVFAPKSETQKSHEAREAAEDREHQQFNSRRNNPSGGRRDGGGGGRDNRSGGGRREGAPGGGARRENAQGGQREQSRPAQDRAPRDFVQGRPEGGQGGDERRSQPKTPISGKASGKPAGKGTFFKSGRPTASGAGGGRPHPAGRRSQPGRRGR